MHPNLRIFPHSNHFFLDLLLRTPYIVSKWIGETQAGGSTPPENGSAGRFPP